MAPKKKTTKNRKAKRDIIDFFVDASKRTAAIGPHFMAEFKNGKVKAKELHQKLVEWGYDGVSLEDVQRMLKIYRASNKAKDLVLERGY